MSTCYKNHQTTLNLKLNPNHIRMILSKVKTVQQKTDGYKGYIKRPFFHIIMLKH